MDPYSKTRKKSSKSKHKKKKRKRRTHEHGITDTTDNSSQTDSETESLRRKRSHSREFSSRRKKRKDRERSDSDKHDRNHSRKNKSSSRKAEYQSKRSKSRRHQKHLSGNDSITISDSDDAISYKKPAHSDCHKSKHKRKQSFTSSHSSSSKTSEKRKRSKNKSQRTRESSVSLSGDSSLGHNSAKGGSRSRGKEHIKSRTQDSYSDSDGSTSSSEPFEFIPNAHTSNRSFSLSSEDDLETDDDTDSVKAFERYWQEAKNKREEERERREEEKRWHEKMAEETHFEYAENWGQFEDDHGFNDHDGESYDDWADRISKEWHRKQQAKYPTSHDQQRNRRKQRDTKSSRDEDQAKRRKKISDEAKREFDRKQREEFQGKHSEMQNDMKRGIASRTNNQKRLYEQRLGEILNKTAETKLGFKDIPWPFVTGKGVESMPDLLFCDLEKGSSAYKKYLKKQQICWHPDRFVQKLGNRLMGKDKAKILKRVNEISQQLNRLAEASGSTK